MSDKSNRSREVLTVPVLVELNPYRNFIFPLEFGFCCQVYLFFGDISFLHQFVVIISVDYDDVTNFFIHFY